MKRSYEITLDPILTGLKIKSLRLSHGKSVKDIQDFFGFLAPQAIYKWERGVSLPSLENLVSLAALYSVRIDDILIHNGPAPTSPANLRIVSYEQQEAAPCCSKSFKIVSVRAA